MREWLRSMFVLLFSVLTPRVCVRNQACVLVDVLCY